MFSVRKWQLSDVIPGRGEWAAKPEIRLPRLLQELPQLARAGSGGQVAPAD